MSDMFLLAFACWIVAAYSLLSFDQTILWTNIILYSFPATLIGPLLFMVIK